MRVLVSLAVLWTEFASANTLLACPSLTTNPSLCVQDCDGNAVAAAGTLANSSSLLPPHPNDLDVSSQSIHAIQGNLTTLFTTPTTLNMSHNAITSVDGGGVLRLPSSITTLDLSYNLLKSLDDVDWGHFPNLSILILKGNNISSMKSPLFPRSLAQLDLSDNPLLDVELSRDTFLQMANMTVSMHTTRQFGDGTYPKRMCPESDLKFLGSNCVCVLAPKPTVHPVVEWLQKYAVIVAGVGVVMFCAFHRRNETAPSNLRDTFLESSCDESSAIHIVDMSMATDCDDDRLSNQP